MSKSTPTVTTKGQQFIAFSVDGQLCAVDTRELVGIASDCPNASYPGLPDGVVGIVQWNGKIYPVVDWFDLGQKVLVSKAQHFLFTDEMAIVVPAPVKVFFAVGEQTLDADVTYRGAISKIYDGQNAQALRITLRNGASEVAHAA